MIRKTLQSVIGAMAVSGLFTSPVMGQQSVAASMKLDHRGLIEIPGVLRASSGHHWGVANLIVFGPSWNTAAQDYALKNIQKRESDGVTRVTGDLEVGGAKVNVQQTVRGVKTESGKSAWRVTWTLRSATDGQPMGLQRAYVMFPFGINETAGRTLTANDGTRLVLPEEKGAEYLPFPRQAKSVMLRQEKTDFGLESDNLNVEVVDGRAQNQDNFQIRLAFPPTKDVESASITFDVWAEFPPFSHREGKDWVAFPFSRTVEPGSILDFSFLNRDTAPAGTYGRIIVGADGHYVYEKQPTRRVRLVGANLCFSANFIEKEAADELAETFRRFGYNTVRFHHTDVTMMKGGWDAWNAMKESAIDPAQLDKLDYLFAAMKKAGLYVSIDLYAMGSYGRAIAGIDKPVRGEVKALVPIHEPAFEAWGEMAMAWMNHVNPHTGLAWKDDPALVNICPLNEDSIASVWRSAKDLYDARFAEWKRDHADSGRTDEQLLARFLTEVKVESNRKIEAFLRANGVKALLSGDNWWDTMAQTFTRDTLDVVDNHQYADHPDRHWLPARYNQKSTLREGNPTYRVPIMKAASRIFGKPFIITEYNFCAPNMHRLEAGGMMGAYAALQDWDALYRFAWSHDAGALREQRRISGFDIATDPLHQLTERQILLLFGRGDVAPAQKRYVYGVTMREATEAGVGDMWARGLFPHPFNAMALMSQIGSQVIEGDRTIQGRFDAVVAAEKPDDASLAGNPFLATRDLQGVRGMQEVVSDTGEIAIDNKKGTLRIMTPNTQCIVAPAGESLQAGSLHIADNTTFASVSISSMDGRPVDQSRRMLMFHLTPVINTDMAFSDETMRTLYDWGRLPYLARTGSVRVTLKHPNPHLRVYAVASNGTRMGRIPADYVDGAHTFTLAIRSDDPHPTMIYEVAAQ